MKKQNPTSIHVARRAGVSQSTVSRVFAKHPSIPAETRAKVLRAAADIGYRPNALARSLSTQRSRIVAVLFSYLDNPFYAAALETLCKQLQEKSYHALVFMMPDTLADIERTVSNLLEYRVDGVVTASVELSSALCEDCLKRGVPVVMFNRKQDDDRLSSVTTDNVSGGRLAARHLVECGCERIALVAGWEGASTNRDREFGFRAELDVHGRSLHGRAVGHFDPVRAAQAARELFASGSILPDGLFVTNDYMAVPVMDVLRSELGLRIPEDVQVIGFDDTPIAALPTYNLTTIRQPVAKMVAATLRILFDQFATPGSEAEHVILGAQLVQRGTTQLASLRSLRTLPQRL